MRVPYSDSNYRTFCYIRICVNCTIVKFDPFFCSNEYTIFVVHERSYRIIHRESGAYSKIIKSTGKRLNRDRISEKFEYVRSEAFRVTHVIQGRVLLSGARFQSAILHFIIFAFVQEESPGTNSLQVPPQRGTLIGVVGPGSSSESMQVRDFQNKLFHVNIYIFLSIFRCKICCSCSEYLKLVIQRRPKTFRTSLGSALSSG